MARATLFWWGLLALTGCMAPGPIQLQQRVRDQADRRETELSKWEDLLLREKIMVVRAASARAIGQINSRKLSSLVQRCLRIEIDPRVRAEEIFALGQIGDPRAVDELMRELDRPEELLRMRAVDALGKLGDLSTASAIIARFQDSSPHVRGAALLALARLRVHPNVADQPLEAWTANLWVEQASALVYDEFEEVRWRAAYTLSRIEVPGRSLALRRAARSEDPLVRLFAIRGLGDLAGTDADVTAAEILPALQDDYPHLAAAAATALGRLANPATAPELIEAAGRTRAAVDHHVRTAALAALAGLGGPDAGALPDGVLGALESGLSDSSSRARRAALRSLAELKAPGVDARIAQFAQSESVWDRAAAPHAAMALPWSDAGPLLESSSADPHVLVRCAVMEAYGEFEEALAPARALALQGTESKDIAVLTCAVQLLGKCGESEDFDLVLKIYERYEAPMYAELLKEAVRAAVELGSEEQVAEFLAYVVDRDRSPAVVDEVRALLKRAGLEDLQPPRREAEPSSVRARAGIDFFVSKPKPRVVLHTDKGEVVLELYPEQAPRHVKSFLDLAAIGSYDGLSFHRVVTGFVVQGLDPRGDGWGDGDVFLRGEINPMQFLAGTVGTPNVGRDSDGCQIFITHVPTPHLDGKYTVFARVVAGMDVLDTLDQGDICQRVEIEQAPAE